jgi:hypothetical protein
MHTFLALIGPIVSLGISWLLCRDGVAALRSETASVRGYRITGQWAQVVGVALLLIGAPLLALSLFAIVGVLAAAFSGSLP